MKKIPTLFVRDFTRDNGRYVTDEVTPGCEWVLAGEGVATRKYDGTCIRVQNDGVYALWARREVKAGKAAPDGFVPVETDQTTGKTVGWEPWAQSSFARFIEEAKRNWAAGHPLPDPWHSDLPPGTYELVGPKINGNPERSDTHVLIPHARATRFGSDWPLSSFDEIRASVIELAADFGCEGIVWHHPDGRMAKIKARDFRALSSTDNPQGDTK